MILQNDIVGFGLRRHNNFVCKLKLRSECCEIGLGGFASGALALCCARGATGAGARWALGRRTFAEADGAPAVCLFRLQVIYKQKKDEFIF